MLEYPTSKSELLQMSRCFVWAHAAGNGLRGEFYDMRRGDASWCMGGWAQQPSFSILHTMAENHWSPQDVVVLSKSDDEALPRQ